MFYGVDSFNLGLSGGAPGKLLKDHQEAAVHLDKKECVSRQKQACKERHLSMEELKWFLWELIRREQTKIKL